MVLDESESDALRLLRLSAICLAAAMVLSKYPKRPGVGCWTVLNGASIYAHRARNAKERSFEDIVRQARDPSTPEAPDKVFWRRVGSVTLDSNSDFARQWRNGTREAFADAERNHRERLHEEYEILKDIVKEAYRSAATHAEWPICALYDTATLSEESLALWLLFCWCQSRRSGMNNDSEVPSQAAYLAMVENWDRLKGVDSIANGVFGFAGLVGLFARHKLLTRLSFTVGVRAFAVSFFYPMALIALVEAPTQLCHRDMLEKLVAQIIPEH